MKFKNLFEGDVVRINTFVKNVPSQDEDDSWASKAEKAHWRNRKTINSHFKNPPKIEGKDVFAAQGPGFGLPGHSTSSMDKRIDWATTTHDLIGHDEGRVLDGALGKHGFKRYGGSSTHHSDYSWGALAKGSRTSETSRTYRYEGGKAAGQHGLTITRTADDLKWSHTFYRRGMRGGTKTRASGSSHAELESYLHDKFPIKKDGE